MMGKYNPLLNLINEKKSYIKVNKRGNIHLGENCLSEWNTSTLSINGSLSTNIKHIPTNIQIPRSNTYCILHILVLNLFYEP